MPTKIVVSDIMVKCKTPYAQHTYIKYSKQKFSYCKCNPGFYQCNNCFALDIVVKMILPYRMIN